MITLQIHIYFITIILVNEIILNKAEKRLFTTYKQFPENTVGMFQTENSCSIFDNSFRPSRRFFGKWNSFVQMVNAIPGKNYQS